MVSEEPYTLQRDQRPNSGDGVQMGVKRFSVETLPTLSNFCFFVFRQNLTAYPG